MDLQEVVKMKSAKHTETDRAVWFVHVVQYTAEELGMPVTVTARMLDESGLAASVLSGYQVWHTQGFEYMAEMLADELNKAQGV